MGYFIKRTNVSADHDVTIIGKRGYCGKSAEPFDAKSSAETALKRQQRQDEELCPECVIRYEVVQDAL